MTVCPVEMDFNEARIKRKIKHKQKPVTSSELTSLLEPRGFLQMSTVSARERGIFCLFANDPISHTCPCVSKEKFSLNVESNFCEFYLDLPTRHYFLYKIRKVEIDEV